MADQRHGSNLIRGNCRIKRQPDGCRFVPSPERLPEKPLVVTTQRFCSLLSALTRLFLARPSQRQEQRDPCRQNHFRIRCSVQQTLNKAGLVVLHPANRQATTPDDRLQITQCQIKLIVDNQVIKLCIVRHLIHSLIHTTFNHV